MNLEKVKVGDEVYSCLAGWEEVVSVIQSHTYPIQTEQGTTYTLKGERLRTHINPEIIDWRIL